MTREEEIRQASIEYTIGNRPMCIGGGAFLKMVDELNRNKSFEDGAKWADKTMIDKACTWLRANIDLYTDTRRSFLSNYQEVYLTDNFEKEFRKAMQNE